MFMLHFNVATDFSEHTRTQNNTDGYFLSLTLCGIKTNELCSAREEYTKYVVSMS